MGALVGLNYNKKRLNDVKLGVHQLPLRQFEIDGEVCWLKKSNFNTF